MKKALSLMAIAFAFVACNSGSPTSSNTTPETPPAPKPKKYIYVEMLKGRDLFNQLEYTKSKPDTITAIDDSVAYTLAIKKYITRIYARKLAARKLMEAGGKPSDYAQTTAYDFILVGENGVDLSDGSHLVHPEVIAEEFIKSMEEIAAKWDK